MRQSRYHRLTPLLFATLCTLSTHVSANEASGRVEQAGDRLIDYLRELPARASHPTQQTLAHTLAEQLPSLVAEHPTWQMSATTLQARRAAEREADAARWPQLQGNSGYQWQRESGSDSNAFQIGLQASQLLYDFDATGSQIAAAQAQREAGEAALVAQEQQLLLRGITAWYELYRERQLLRLRQLNVTARGEIAQFVAERERLGGSSRSDRLRAEARHAEAEAELALAQAQVDAAVATWQEIFATEPPVNLAIRLDSPDTARYRRDLTSIVNRFAPLREAIAQQHAAQLSARASSAAQLPKLSLEAALSQQFRDGAELDRLVALQFSSDLYNGGATTARIDQARAAATRAQAEADDERRQAIKSLQQVLAEVEAAPHALAARQRAVEVAAESLIAVREQFAFRRGTLLDLLRAQEDLYYTGRDLINRMIDTALAYQRLRYLASEL